MRLNGPPGENGENLEESFHEMGEDCVCGPTPLFDAEGTVWVHHSLDGRELYERLFRLMGV